jgi:hypothetical protein
MKRIGIYYHPSFSRKSYMTVSNLMGNISWSME